MRKKKGRASFQNLLNRHFSGSGILLASFLLSVKNFNVLELARGSSVSGREMAFFPSGPGLNPGSTMAFLADCLYSHWALGFFY